MNRATDVASLYHHFESAKVVVFGWWGLTCRIRKSTMGYCRCCVTCMLTIESAALLIIFHDVDMLKSMFDLFLTKRCDCSKKRFRFVSLCVKIQDSFSFWSYQNEPRGVGPLGSIGAWDWRVVDPFVTNLRDQVQTQDSAERRNNSANSRCCAVKKSIYFKLHHVSLLMLVVWSSCYLITNICLEVHLGWKQI